MQQGNPRADGQRLFSSQSGAANRFPGSDCSTGQASDKRGQIVCSIEQPEPLDQLFAPAVFRAGQTSSRKSCPDKLRPKPQPQIPCPRFGPGGRQILSAFVPTPPL